MKKTFLFRKIDLNTVRLLLYKCNTNIYFNKYMKKTIFIVLFDFFYEHFFENKE